MNSRNDTNKNNEYKESANDNLCNEINIINRIPTYHGTYRNIRVLKRVGIYTIKEVLSLIDIKKTYRGKFILKKFGIKVTFFVGEGKKQLQVFKKKLGTQCVGCGLRAEYFALEEISVGHCNMFKFNLYGRRNGEEILFTKDHIKPRSKGGKDKLSNLQTMCLPCNIKKGSGSSTSISES